MQGANQHTGRGLPALRGDEAQDDEQYDRGDRLPSVTLLANTWMLWRLHEVESRILQGGGMAQGVRGSQ